MPSPRPLPTETKKIRGTFRKDRASVDEPTDSVALPECPDWLTDEGKAEWERLAPLLLARRTVTEASRGLLATLCQAWGVFVHSSIKYNRLVDDPGADAVETRRYCTSMLDAATAYVRVASEFGIGPASRTKVTALPAKKDGDGKEKFFRAG